jgi:hypothetical protein
MPESLYSNSPYVLFLSVIALVLSFVMPEMKHLFFFTTVLIVFKVFGLWNEEIRHGGLLFGAAILLCRGKALLELIPGFPAGLLPDPVLAFDVSNYVWIFFLLQFSVLVSVSITEYRSLIGDSKGCLIVQKTYPVNGCISGFFFGSG